MEVENPFFLDSPLEAGYIFADCFSLVPILLAVRRRTIHVTSIGYLQRPVAIGQSAIRLSGKRSGGCRPGRKPDL